MEKLRKALDERLEKAKYTKRTGSPGKYKYEYGTRTPKGRAKGTGSPDTNKGQNKRDKKSGKFKGSKANEAALDEMGFSAKQADNLNRRGVKAATVDKMSETTENEDLMYIDGLYKYFMGNVSTSEFESGVTRYKGNMQRAIDKETKRNPAKKKESKIALGSNSEKVIKEVMKNPKVKEQAKKIMDKYPDFDNDPMDALEEVGDLLGKYIDFDSDESQREVGGGMFNDELAEYLSYKMKD